MDALALKSSTSYNILNTVFKLIVIVVVFILIIFYFNFNPFKLRIFKDNKHNNNYKPHEANRNLTSSVNNSKYANETLSSFYIKTAFDCSRRNDRYTSVDRLKQIISQGFRCLDFKLYLKNSNILVENQIQGEMFYDMLQAIDKYAFSNSFCSNYDDPIILNIRLDVVSTMNYQNLQNIYNKIRDVFNYNSSKFMLDSQYSLKQNLDDINSHNRNSSYINVLSIPISQLKRKIIVMCNYDFDTANNNIKYSHNLLQYIHINSFIVDKSNMSQYNNIDAVVNDATNSTFDNSLILTQQTFDVYSSNVNTFISTNKLKLNMIIPNILMGFVIQNLPQYIDKFGFSLRAVDVSSIHDFTNDSIDDIDIQNYLQDFDKLGYALVLKPDSLR